MALGAFNRSPLGAFIKSPLGVRGIAVAEGPFYAIRDISAPYKILVSKNGVTWTENSKQFYYPSYPNWFFNNRVFGFYGYNLYRSNDLTGYSWTSVLSMNSKREDETMYRLASNRLILKHIGDHKCCYSDDDGATWTKVSMPTVTIGPFTGGVMRGTIRVMASGRLVISGASNSISYEYSRALCFYSDNEGSTWNSVIVDNTLTDGYPNCGISSVLLLADDDTLYLLCISTPYSTPPSQKRLYKSMDGGSTWSFVQVVSGSTPYIATGYGGVGTYRLLSGRQIVSEVYSGADPVTMNLWYTDNNGVSWAQVGGNGSFYIGLRRVGNNLYRLIYSSPNTILQVSTNGVDWTTKGTLGNYGTASGGLAIRGMVTQ